MYPVLYAATETAFTSNGIGMLKECTSCIVTEERNGIYECEFTVAVTDKHYADIDIGKIILVPHDETKDLQPFIIYRASKPIDGMVTFNAHHVSYGLSNVVVKPFEATSITQALSKLNTEALTACPFTFWTDKNTAGAFVVKFPSSARALLAGQEGSILDVYGGGEYEFDKYTVKLRQHRGADNGVTIRYGKNLTDIEQVFDYSETYDGVIPYWYDEETDTVVYGSTVMGTGRSGDAIVPLDMSADFEDQPTAAQLESAALTYLDSNAPWKPQNNIDVDFVALWQTDEYKDIAPLERVKLCDTVTVVFPLIGATINEQVIRVEYDALRERYSKIELGQPKQSFAETVVSLAESFTKAAVQESYNDLEQAITDATTLITGGSGGHVVIARDADGKPQEILIMDSESTSTAVNVLRINVNGIGFSSTGINGPYTTAWTLAGGFVADFITSGYLSCNRIKGGTLTLGGLNNGNGVLEINDNDGNLSVLGNKSGIVTNSLTAEDYVYVDGGAGSYLKIPTESDELSYVEIDNGGMKTVNRTISGGVTFVNETLFPSVITDGTHPYTIYEANMDAEYSSVYFTSKTYQRNGWTYYEQEKGNVVNDQRQATHIYHADFGTTACQVYTEDPQTNEQSWIFSANTQYDNYVVVYDRPLRSQWKTMSVATGTEWRSVDLKYVTTVLVLVKISGTNYTEFIIPTIAVGNSSWLLVNQYGATNDGFVRLKIEPNIDQQGNRGMQIQLVDVYNGTTNVTSSAEMWVYYK